VDLRRVARHRLVRQSKLLLRPIVIHMKVSSQKLLAIAVTCVALVSCGGTSDSASTVESSSPVDTNVSTGMSMDDAASKYAAIVRPTNCALMDYSAVESKYDLGNGEVDLVGIDELTTNVGRVASARQKAVEELVGNDWPEEVGDDIEALALFWAGLQRKESAVSKATDLGTWNQSVAEWRGATQSSDSGRSKIIRIKLGLDDFSPSECD